MNIWIYNSNDEPIYFSNPKKAYNYAIRFESDKPKYSTYLSHIRRDGYYAFKEADTSIVKISVL